MKKTSSQKPKPKAISKDGTIFDGVSCYALDNGQRVVKKRTMAAALGGNQLKSDTTEPASFDRYIERLPNGSELLASRPNVEFTRQQGGIGHGIEANTIARMLRLYAEAWGAWAL